MSHSDTITDATTTDELDASAESDSNTSPANATARQRDEDQEERRPSFTVRDRRFWADEEAAPETGEPRAQAPAYVEQLQQQLQEKDKQLREYIAAYKSEVVEGLEKTKQRLERDAAAKMLQLRGRMTEPMLEVLETLERSVQAAEAGTDAQNLLQGIKMVHLLMVQKLQELGLQRVPTVGSPFDPTLHEAISITPVQDAAQDNLIVAEVRPGFKLDERLVRAAQVVVGKAAN